MAITQKWLGTSIEGKSIKGYEIQKYHIWLRKSLSCKWLEAGRSCWGNITYITALIFFPRYSLLFSVRDRILSQTDLWSDPIQPFWCSCVYILNWLYGCSLHFHLPLYNAKPPPSCLQQQTEAEQKYQCQHIFAEKSFLDKFGYLPTLLISCQSSVIAEKSFTLQLWSPETICADLSPFTDSLSPSKFSS